MSAKSSTGKEVLNPIEQVLQETLDEASRREQALVDDSAALAESRVPEALARIEERAANMEARLHQAERQAREVDALLEETGALLTAWQQSAAQLSERVASR